MSCHPKGIEEIDSLIEEFFETCVKNDERLGNVFENIFNGINLLKIAEACSDNLSATTYSIGVKVFYLDTNILLRILELQSDYLNLLGKELLKLLNDYNFEIRVFKNTLDELFYLLRGYKRGHSYFIKGRNISHVYQTLKNRDIEPFQIDDIINEIPNKLHDLGIETDDETTYIPNDYALFDKKISELAKLKFDKKNESESEFDINDFDSQRCIQQAKHDLEAIELIRTLRAKPIINKFEDAEYYFITAESNLLRFNKQEYHYTEIDETIGDYTLSFLLYFYRPGNMKGIALRSFIAANCSNKQLSISNWINYVNLVNEKYKDGVINKSQFGYLLTKTILTNEKFVGNDLNDIVNDGITEFKTIIEGYENLKKEKISSDSYIEKLKLKNDLILNQSEEKDIKILENAGYIYELENDKSTLVTKVKDLDTQIFSLKTQMKNIRIAVFIICGILLIFGLINFISNKTLASILTSLSIVGTTFNIIDHFKKWVIKD